MPDKDYNEGRKIMFLSPTAIREAPERLHPVPAVLAENEEFKDEPFVQSVMEAVREVKSDTEFRRVLMDEKLKEYCIRREEFTKGKNAGEEKELIISIHNLRKTGIGDDRIFDLLRETHSMDKDKLLELMERAD